MRMPTILLLISLHAPAQVDALAKQEAKSSQTSSNEEVTPQKGMSKEEFLAALKAIRKPEAPIRIENFKIKAIFMAQGNGGKVDVEAEILFRQPYYLRTTIQEGKKTIIRGLEGYKTWMSQNGQAYRLQGRGFAEDRQAVRRDAALARLTLRFLYPDRVLEGLVDLKGPTKVTSRIRKNRKASQVEVWEMRGKAARPKDYPLVLSPDHEGNIEITAWFDMKTLEPLRVFLRPLGKDGKPIAMRKEAIYFSEFKWNHGLRVPHRLGFFQPDPTKKVERLHKVSTIKIQKFDVPKEPWNKSLFRMPK